MWYKIAQHLLTHFLFPCWPLGRDALRLDAFSGWVCLVFVEVGSGCLTRMPLEGGVLPSSNSLQRSWVYRVTPQRDSKHFWNRRARVGFDPALEPILKKLCAILVQLTGRTTNIRAVIVQATPYHTPHQRSSPTTTNNADLSQPNS